MVGCWSPFFDHGGAGRARCRVLVDGGGVLVAICQSWWWWALVGGIGWWLPLMVLVGACHRLLVVVVRAHGVVVAVRGCSWLVSEGGGGLFVGGGMGAPHCL